MAVADTPTTSRRRRGLSLGSRLVVWYLASSCVIVLLSAGEPMCGRWSPAIGSWSVLGALDDHLSSDLYPRRREPPAWQQLREDYERFATFQPDIVNRGIEWLTWRYVPRGGFEENKWVDTDGDATPAGQLRELCDGWERPLVVLLPWVDEEHVMLPGRVDVLIVRHPPDEPRALRILSLGEDGELGTQDDLDHEMIPYP
ncbi:MAG: hypothetical protein R3F05_06775 [Planctomycetota bacterium]